MCIDHPLTERPKLSLTITRSLNVLVVGGGRAGYLKASSALKQKQLVTLLSERFNSECSALPCWQVQGDLYQWQWPDFEPFDLIYLALPWPHDEDKQQHLKQLCNQLMAKERLLCVSCRPELGNVVNPCVRQVGEYQLALSGSGDTPAVTRELTNSLAAHLAKIQQQENPL
ncbi:NAD(P)-dependent oxidoreductase [Ferrimonas aestuarii]|uniref:Precorrin-2 dehydrogenase n=1 Tax=Ferrimonas aestuarii TaxID=2569539 RepID=A0A4U1BFW6_9GAMM|nr:NAD(P)-dependent oxidoreductase [Ferrimonas aestuarii]TKB50053.1 hypothetical protein FCL42_19915 [Ferrimonas aestuarii]